MRIEILSIGRIKAGAYSTLQQTYHKRLSRYTRVSLTEVKGYRKGGSVTDTMIRTKESAALLERIKEKTFLVVLDSRGTALSSNDFAVHLRDWRNRGIHSLTFVVGGAVGLSETIRAKADFILSLSSMTFQHDMAQIILLEQLYRSFTILQGGKYHK